MRRTVSRLKALALLASVWSVGFGVAGADTALTLKVPKATNSFVLPSRFSEGFFYLSARIGNEGPFNLILDTGASYLIISPEVAGKLHTAGRLIMLQKTPMETASQKRVVVDQVMVSDVQLGEFVIPRAKAVVSDLAMLTKAAGERLDGVVGLEGFEFADLILDYPGRQVRVEAPGVRDRDTNSVILNCEFRFHRPIVSIEVAGTKFQMYIDSGSDGGFGFPIAQRDLPFAASPATVALAETFAETLEQKSARLATNVHWAGVMFERPVVDLTHMEIGMIGSGVLENYVVRIDQRRKELGLTPPPQTNVYSPPIRSTGLSLLPDVQGLKVMAVIPNTTAARAGIQRGDYVVAVNGEPARRWNKKRLRELKEKADSFEIELLRGDKTERLRLQIATLIE